MLEKGIKFVGFGSPLMDMIADVSAETIKKHNLKLNETIHMKMSETKIFNILEEEAKITYVAGGCSYNTMRVLNWILNDDNGKVALIGAVGKDKYGDLYSDLLKKENIVPLFEQFEEVNTGICAVYCNNRDRGHVTDLGASILVSDKMLSETKEVLQNAELIFTELFILKHKKEFVNKLAEIGSSSKKVFGFNLPSFYFIETFLEDIKHVLKFADVVFTNAAEASFFAKLCKFSTDSENLADVCKFMASYEKKNTDKKRVVVITNGPDPAYVAEYDFITQSFTFTGIFPVAYLEEEKIIDANGAGDAFAGGFLAKFMKGCKLEECVYTGHWAASQIIQTRGCQFPKNCDIFSYN
jgi:adenosine kinase